MKLHGLVVPYFYIHVSMSDLYISMIGPRQTDPWNIYIAHRLHECGNWQTENHNSDLEIMRPCSFISGIHISKPDIYIGFSQALHLQCIQVIQHIINSLSHRY
jgi:hypothetical protein